MRASPPCSIRKVAQSLAHMLWPLLPHLFRNHAASLLVLCTIIHFYTTGHLTMVTALKAIDPEFEAVSASLKVPFYKTFWHLSLIHI